MSASQVYVNIEKRLETLLELSRRNQNVSDKVGFHPTITISREFGCEGGAVAEMAQTLLQEKMHTPWGLMDKAILDMVANDRDHAVEVLRKMGAKNSYIDDMLSTIFTEWKSDKDYFKLLCNQIIPFARGGHVIIVGVGAGLLTQNLPNCYQFRILAPMEFKINSVSRRHSISKADAEKLIVKSDKQRNAFIKGFLNRDVTDPALYTIVFNRAKNSVEQIAEMITQRIMFDAKKEK